MEEMNLSKYLTSLLVFCLFLLGCDMSTFSENRVVGDIAGVATGDNTWIAELSREEGPMWMLSIETRKTPISWGISSPSVVDANVTVSLRNADGAELLVVRPGGQRDLVSPGGSLELYRGSLKALAHPTSIVYLHPQAGGTKVFRVEYVIRSDTAVKFDAVVPLIAYRSP